MVDPAPELERLTPEGHREVAAARAAQGHVLEVLASVESTHGGRPHGVVRDALVRQLDRRGLGSWLVEEPEVHVLIRAISQAART